MLEALQPCLGDQAQITGAEQGLHLCLRLPSHVDDRHLTQRIADHGLTVRPLSAYCIKRTDARGLVIGYGYAALADIERYGPVLSKVISQELKRLNRAAT